MRRVSGKAIALPHSGAPPAHARKRARSGAIAITTCCRGRGSPGNVSVAAACSASDRASCRSWGKKRKTKRSRSRRSCATSREPGAASTNSEKTASRRSAHVIVRCRRAAPGSRLGSRLPPPASRLRFSPLLYRLRRLGAALSPRIELVRGIAVLPRLPRFVLLPVEPVRASQLAVRFYEIRAERQRLLEEGLGILEHVPLEVHEPEVEARVRRRLLVVIETDGARQVLDGLVPRALLETDVADVDACERVLRLAHEHLLEPREGVVVLLLQHQRPAEQRLGVRVVG